LIHRMTTSILNQAAREYDVVFVAFSLGSLLAAVAAGLRGALLSRRGGAGAGGVCGGGLLPKPPGVHFGVYLRGGGGNGLRTQLADAMVEALRSSSQNGMRGSDVPGGAAGESTSDPAGH